jgi:hypothetical protein
MVQGRSFRLVTRRFPLTPASHHKFALFSARRCCAFLKSQIPLFFPSVLALCNIGTTAYPDLGESGDSQEALNRRVLARLIRWGLERCGDPILAR